MLIDANARDWIETEATARGMGAPCLRVTTPDRLRREMFVRGVGSYVPFAPPPLQLEVEVPVDAETIEISFKAEPRTGSFGRGGTEVVTPVLLVKEGAPITYTYNEGNNIDVESDHDALYEDLAEGFLAFPVTGGTTLYLGFGNTADPEMVVDEIEVVFPGIGGGTGTGGESTGTGTSGDGTTGEGDSSTSGGAATTTDSGGTSGDETDGETDGGEGQAAGDGGCGCRTDGPVSPAWALWLPVLVGRRRP
jgi:hypothetical protein